MNDQHWRIAVVGLDHMHAGDHVAMIAGLPDADLVGVWDKDRERLTRFCAELQLDDDLAFGDLDQLLNETRPDIAIVCTTTADHRQVTEQLAARKIHVLLEKPFGPSIEDVHAMIAAADHAGVSLGVNWPLAWYPSHRTAYRLASEGHIGQITEVHYYDGNRGPLFHTHGKKEIDSEEAARLKASSWWYDARAGGGSLRDYLGYGTTLATWFRGGELPLDVLTRTHHDGDDAVDEQAVTIASYSSGLSTFQTRWGTFTDPWTYQPWPRCGFVLVGRSGTIASWDYEDVVHVQSDDNPQSTPVDVDSIPFHESGGLPNLLHCLRLELPLYGPLSSATSLAGQRIVEAAATSAAERRIVALSEIP